MPKPRFSLIVGQFQVDLHDPATLSISYPVKLAAAPLFLIAALIAFLTVKTRASDGRLSITLLQADAGSVFLLLGVAFLFSYRRVVIDGRQKTFALTVRTPFSRAHSEFPFGDVRAIVVKAWKGEDGPSAHAWIEFAKSPSIALAAGKQEKVENLVALASRLIGIPVEKASE